MTTFKSFKPGQQVTMSADRSHKVDCNITLLLQRPDISERWKSEDGQDHDIWEAMCEGTKVIVYNKTNDSRYKSQFLVEPFAEEEFKSDKVNQVAADTTVAKTPKAGSKSEEIYNRLLKGDSPSQICKDMKVYHSQVSRVVKNYL